MLKRALNIMVWAAMLTVVVASMAFTSKQKLRMRISEVEVEVDRSNNNFFIQEDEIKRLVRSLGYIADSLPIDSIDINRIEQRLESNPSIKNADVFLNVDGSLRIYIEQRTPMARIFNQYGESFYLDVDGGLMPLSKNFSARVPIVQGNIRVKYSSLSQFNSDLLNTQLYIDSERPKTIYYKSSSETLKIDSIPGLTELKAIYELSKFINQDPFWSKQISEIRLNREGDFELIPIVGMHTIIFGKTDNMPQKFKKLMAFYKQGLSKTGWNEFETINLKFNNQVVCTKKYH